MKKLLLASLCLTATTGFCQNSINLYGQTIKASEVLPAGRTFGPPSVYKTILLATHSMSPPSKPELNELLGAVYTTQQLNADPQQLLNFDSDDSFPILDSINCTFYRAQGFRILEKKGNSVTKQPQYDSLKAKFNALKACRQQAALLKEDAAYKDLSTALAATRFTTYSNSVSITALTKINSGVKAGLAANLEAAIKANGNGIELKPELKTQISKAVDKTVTLKGAKYHEIRLDDNYIGYANLILEPLSKNISSIPRTNLFNRRLIDYFNSCNSAIIGGAAVFECQFENSRSTTFDAEIAAAIKASLARPMDAAQLKLAGDVTAKAVRKVVSQFGTLTEQNFYYLRYAYFKELELGCGAKN